MMERLLKRGEELAGELQSQAMQHIAALFKELVANASVEIDSDRVLLSGRDILKRWLTNPALRFFRGSK